MKLVLSWSLLAILAVGGVALLFSGGVDLVAGAGILDGADEERGISQFSILLGVVAVALALLGFAGVHYLRRRQGGAGLGLDSIAAIRERAYENRIAAHAEAPPRTHDPAPPARSQNV
jgi:hypothetical protein